MPEVLTQTAIQLALPNTIPGPAESPNDRGECLELLDATTKPVTRCDGRMIASYRGETDTLLGFFVWTCAKCGKVVVP